MIMLTLMERMTRVMVTRYWDDESDVVADGEGDADDGHEGDGNTDEDTDHDDSDPYGACHDDE